MQVCIICGKDACGEEKFEKASGGGRILEITGYFCKEHINQVAIPEVVREKMEQGKGKASFEAV